MNFIDRNLKHWNPHIFSSEEHLCFFFLPVAYVSEILEAMKLLESVSVSDYFLKHVSHGNLSCYLKKW